MCMALGRSLTQSHSFLFSKSAVKYLPYYLINAEFAQHATTFQLKILNAKKDSYLLDNYQHNSTLDENWLE